MMTILVAAALLVALRKARALILLGLLYGLGAAPAVAEGLLRPVSEGVSAAKRLALEGGSVCGAVAGGRDGSGGCPLGLCLGMSRW